MARSGPDPRQLHELLLQSLEHEKGGVLIYNQALQCATNEDLVEEWEGYLAETEHHVEVLEQVCEDLEIDTTLETPGVLIVRQNGEALVRAMQQALRSGDPALAQIVACECVVLAETKDHANWELIGRCAAKTSGPVGTALKRAVDEVEDQEDEHLYHTRGWCRELWLESLGLAAVLPPPEERKHVKTAIGAARAEQASLRSR